MIFEYFPDTDTPYMAFEQVECSSLSVTRTPPLAAKPGMAVVLPDDDMA